MANTLTGIISLPLVQIQGSIARGACVAGSLGMPLTQIQGSIVQGSVAFINAILPPVTFFAEGGGELILRLPVVSFTAHGSTDVIGRFNILLPRVLFSANALQERIATLNLNMPAVRFTATGKVSEVTSLSVILPHLKFTAHGLTGVVGRINAILPATEFHGNAYWTGTNTLNIVMPAVKFFAMARSSAFITLVLNTKNFALTEYDNSYNYNSLCSFNGKMVGGKRDGIYELSGETDNGTSIEWNFKTGKIDLEDGMVKKARHVWLSYKPSGDLILTVDDGDNEYEYDVESAQQIDNAVRIKLGKGIRNRYIQLALRNVSNEKITLDRIRLFADPIARKR